MSTILGEESISNEWRWTIARGGGRFNLYILFLNLSTMLFLVFVMTGERRSNLKLKIKKL